MLARNRAFLLPVQADSLFFREMVDEDQQREIYPRLE